MGSRARRLRQEPFDESSARICVRSETGTPHSEPFDELSPRILNRGTPTQSGNRQTAINSRHTLIEIKLCQVPLEGERNDHRKRLSHSKQHREDNESCVDRH